MEKNNHQYDKDKIKFATFNLSGKANEIEIDGDWCSKYLSTLQILFRGEFQSWNNSKSRNALLSGFNMINGNLIGKTSSFFY